MKGSLRTSLVSRKLLVVLALGIASSIQSLSAQAQGFSWLGNDPSDFIIGGTTVAATDVIASTTVAIVTDEGKGMIALCTGSILDKDLIVTAGHCVGPSADKMVIAFRRDLTDKSDTGPVVKVADYVRDPDYVAPSANGQISGTLKDMNDIALIRFDGGLPTGYQPATLMDASDKLKKGEAVTLAGYGIMDGSTAAQQSGADGAGVLREVDTTIYKPTYGKTELMVDETHGKASCEGDSGGPAFVKDDDGTLKLFGVTSRGSENCNTYGIYTNILAHLDFIQQATDKLRAGVSQ